MPHTPTFHMYPCGDQAITMELGDTIEASIHQKVMDLFTLLQSLHLKAVKDIIPAYHSITVVYDVVELAKISQNNTVYEMMCNQLEKAVSQKLHTHLQSDKLVRIPVCYEQPLALDLQSLAALHSITTEEVIQLHSNRQYRVFMLGFLPGFSYMGKVNEKICTPRKVQPRKMVPAGSVGIAGEQTGIYPFDSPGGWQIIGQTPIPMFSYKNEDPCYLHPGDVIEFYPISLVEFNKLKNV